jgi:PAS domain S-box-containing protein
MVYFLGEDRERRLWLGTGDGVDVITPAGIDHFDQSDGLAGDDSIANAFLLDRDGSLWLGASGGATHLLAQYYRGPLAPPRTTFLTGRLGGFDLDLDRTRSTTEVPHEHNALTLDFAPSTLLEPKRLEYQVRLLPIDREWTTTRERHHHFPALPSDAYRFAVRTRIGTGSWGPTTELGFAILPAWWQTRWFVVLVVAGALAAIAGAFTWRQRRVLSNRTRLLHARSDASFRAVIDAMPDLISVYRDRRLIYLNHACRQFLGITSEDRWEELDPTDWLHPGDRALVIEVFRRLRALDPKVSSEVFEIRLRAADASWRVCELSGILAEIGGAHTIVISARDVTERKRMRAKLLVTDRMASLGTLAAGIAHEINNPLAYVIGNLEALAETVEAAGHAPIATCGELSGAIHDARDGAERVRKIVQGLRSFSRSEDEERVPLALPGVLDAAIRLTANQVRHRAQLVRELAATPLVIADDGRLTQVFINLLVNAAHAIPEGHSDENRITLRTRTDDHGRAVVEIEDTGRGMAPDVQSRVFDPFFTTKNVGEGTGLGLSICHGIISGLGGQITIESTVARGTIVRVVLPGQPGVAAVFAPAPEPDTAPPVRQRRRVLLVDDEPQVAQTMERLLRKDYDVTIALCGRDGLKRIADGLRFDAIVSDVMMPNMTGIELLEELCRIAPDQARRMIFLSGGTFTAQTRERLDELGAPQLEKPVTAKQLRATVAQIATTGTATPLAATGTDG